MKKIKKKEERQSKKKERERKRKERETVHSGGCSSRWRCTPNSLNVSPVHLRIDQCQTETSAHGFDKHSLGQESLL